jgi:uncharacterized protein (DUF433 family)
MTTIWPNIWHIGKESAAMATETNRTIPEVEQVEGVLYEPLSGRAIVWNTGLEVFEIVRTWLEVGKDWERFTRAYHWLTTDELQAGLDFYERNTALVNERLARERAARVEDVWERNPKSRPPRR